MSKTVDTERVNEIRQDILTIKILQTKIKKIQKLKNTYDHSQIPSQLFEEILK